MAPRHPLWSRSSPQTDDSSHDLPPLTLTAEGEYRLKKLRQGDISSPAGLVRILGELRVRGGFDWRMWKQICERPLFINPSVSAEEERWRNFLGTHVRVRLTDDIRSSIQNEFASPKADLRAEERRARILGGLTDERLTLTAWEALREEVKGWDDALLSDSSCDDLEATLCRTVREGLRETELTRSAYDALRRLIEHRNRIFACRQLLADLHHFDPRERLVKHSREDLTATMERIGHSLTLSELLYDITSVDIAEYVNRHMIKWCGAFRDQGIAGWSMPYRQLGFYRAGRRLATEELSLGLGEVDGWHEAVLNLPERPEDCLLHTLRSLQIPEQHHAPYLSRHLLKLSGWAALVKWREHHPLHFKQVEEHIDLVEYLAVRLFCESMLIRQACREIWGLEGTIPKLHDLHRDHPYEFYLRREFFRGELPDYLLESRCRSLLRANPQNDRDRWIRTAEMAWEYRQATALGRDPLPMACQHAWRLFLLSQLLGLSAGNLRKLSPSDGDRLLAMLNTFPSSAHEPIWQAAYEGHYQRELLDRLARNPVGLTQPDDRPRAQLFFYETFGTAGFFGVVMNSSSIGDHKVTPLCPIVVTPTHYAKEEPASDQLVGWERTSGRQRWLAFLKHLFKSLTKDFLTSYFVIDLAAAVMAIVLLGKTLLSRRFELAMHRLHDLFVRPVRTRLTIDVSLATETPGHRAEQRGFSFEQQVGLVEGQFRLIGLTKTFARLGLILGHGSTSQITP